MLTSSTVEQFPEGKAVITVSGALSLGASLKLLDSQLQNLVDSDVSDLLIDLSGVDYMDSAGLGLLVHTYGLLNAKQGKMKLVGVRPRVMKLFKITRLDTFLSIEESSNSPAPGAAAAAPGSNV